MGLIIYLRTFCIENLSEHLITSWQSAFLNVPFKLRELFLCNLVIIFKLEYINFKRKITM